MELRDKQTSESRISLYREQMNTMDMDTQQQQQYSFVDKMKQCVRFITVEPVLFLYIFAWFLASNALTYLTYEMTCRVNLKLNDTICSDMTSAGEALVKPLLDEFEKRNDQVQTDSILGTNLTDLLSPGKTKQISASTISLIMLICCATFSDQHKKRKPLIVLPLLGQVFSCLGLILCAVFISKWSLEYYYFMALIFPAFFGGEESLIVAVFSYASDTSKQEDRTFKLGIVRAFALLAIPIGTAFADSLFFTTRYYGTFATSLIVIFMAMVYGKVFLKEKRPVDLNCSLLLEVFNPITVVVHMCDVILIKRDGYRRFLIIMTYVCYILMIGSTQAEEELSTDGVELIKTNYTFQYSIGIFIATILLTKIFKMNDYLIAIISCTIRIIVGFCYAFGSQDIIVFGSIINIVSGLFIVTLRSIVTKLVDPSEIVKSLSWFVVCEYLCPLVFNDMYNQFFQYTKDTFNKSFYLFTSGILIVPLILLLGMYFLYKDSLEEEHQPEEQQNETEQYNNDIETKKL